MDKEEIKKRASQAKEGLIDLAISFLNTKSGLSTLDIEDEELELFIRDKNRRAEFIEEIKPRISQYEITGRIFDKQTGDPLSGATIVPIQCFIPEGQSKLTNAQGKFSIKVEVPVVGKEVEKVVLKPQFLIKKEEYLPTTQNLINRDNTLKTDLPTTELTNIEKAAEEVVKEVQIKMDEGVQKLQNVFLNGFDKIIVLRRKAINKFTDVIKVRLLPLAIQIFTLFGIAKIQNMSEGLTCPDSSTLDEAIKKRNRIVKQLNQIYSVIITNSAIAGVALLISSQLKGIISQINTLPIPLGSPIGVGLPYAFVGTLDAVKDKLQEISDDNKSLNKQILMSLIFLVASLVIILIYLKKIDEQIQKCSQDINLDPLSNGLLALREENENSEETQIDSNINGFIFSVEEDKNGVGNLKRRFAVAKNKNGVILLRGEPSFSSNDQILIDELKFYIKINNLKAF